MHALVGFRLIDYHVRYLALLEVADLLISHYQLVDIGIFALVTILKRRISLDAHQINQLIEKFRGS